MGLRAWACPGDAAPVPRVRPFPGLLPAPLGPRAVPLPTPVAGARGTVTVRRAGDAALGGSLGPQIRGALNGV